MVSIRCILLRQGCRQAKRGISMEFDLLGYKYKYLHYRPNPKADYGLAITFWKTNLAELEFFLKYVNTWLCREWVDISICSNWHCPDRLYDLCNYVVHCETDLGHQNGTTLHCNGAIHPLVNDHFWTITHTDADTIILNEAYFLGQINRLIISDKALLTSGPSFVYNDNRLVGHKKLGPHSETADQFGSMFVMNMQHKVMKLYFPIAPRGNFETDRKTQFTQSTAGEALILPRMEHEVGLLKGFDFHLGVMHNCNVGNSLERFRRIMGVSI